MGNSKAREYTKQREREEAWTHAMTKPRLATEDVCAQGIGLRRLQLIICPSFEPGYAWELRQLDDEWVLYRSELISDAGPLELIGLCRVPFASSALEAFFNRIESLSVPISLHPIDVGGLDGTIYQLAVFGGMYSEVRYQWWSEPPPAWKPLVDIATEMIRMLSAIRG